MPVELLPLSFAKLSESSLATPEPFSVLAYVPDNNREFYGGHVIDQLILNNPDTHFIILGDSKAADQPNCEIHSIDLSIDMQVFYERVSVLIRLTQHDGLSNMVLEALAYGRHVIWTSKFPYCQHTLPNLEEAQKALDLIKSSKENTGAAGWVKSTFILDHALEDLIKTFDDPQHKIKTYDLD